MLTCHRSWFPTTIQSQLQHSISSYKTLSCHMWFFPSFVQPKKRKQKPIFSSRVNSVDRKKAREIWTQVNRRKELEWTWHFYVCRLLIKTLRFRNERLRERLEGKRIKERLRSKNKLTWRRKKENQLVFDVTKSRRWVWASVLE